MKITVLDAETLGKDLSLKPLEELGECLCYPSTPPELVAERITDSDVLVLNKIKLNGENLSGAKNLKLICVAATGFDNIDTAFCNEHGIAVCNVPDYSSNSVAQLTLAMVLALSVHLSSYTDFIKTGAYSSSGIANRLTPVYHELAGLTWGVVGLGNIGTKVATVAKAFGCKVLACKQTPTEGYACTDINTLCKESDIITLHTPLTPSTRNLIDAARIATMKDGVILVNAARGAVTDEQAIVDAVISGKIGGFGSDVYTVEPFPQTHPFYQIKDLPQVCLTPHMAWGSYEARNRCLGVIVSNIQAFFTGKIQNRVEL